MYHDPQVAERLPPEAEMNRSDALTAFIVVCNTVRPEHPYCDDPFAPYPLSRDDVEYGVTRSHYATCGPRKPPSPVVAYSTRLTHISTISREEHLALLVHECTHIPVCGRATGETSGHPPKFWRRYAFLASELRDAIQNGILRPVFGEIDVERFLECVANNPKPATVDRRYWSVEEAQEEMRELLGLD